MTALADLATAAGLLRSLAVYYGQPWRRLALHSLYAGLVAPGDLAFDIGAHVGNRTRTLLKLGARVVAVEPQPAFAAFLARSLRNRATLVRAAVGELEGEAELRISRRHPTVSTLSEGFIASVGKTEGFRHVEWDGSARVAVTTLDRLIAEHGVPAFVKIDVEGHEAAILRGLTTPVRLVAFEYVPAAVAVAVACIDRLETLGAYRFNRVVGEGGRFVDVDWSDGAEMRRTLMGLGPDAPSGDVYARLAA